MRQIYCPVALVRRRAADIDGNPNAHTVIVSLLKLRLSDIICLY
ncbi:hypothetical protein [Ferrimonas balearica]|nr:hypothetical protein [Ferrimonas balearica]